MNTTRLLDGLNARAGWVGAELEAVCTSREWQRRLIDGGPYASAEAVYLRSDEAVAGLSPADFDEALAGHPRIGERAQGSSSHSALSASEQRGMSSATDELTRLMREGNLEYERRFGRVYLVCATGLSADELYSRLVARLGNDDETEDLVARAELAKINRLRLRGLLEG
jgi:2-oxo-4-hydroxy-4-carboxy-5-ureidoimidazoline decarboxylase